MKKYIIAWITGAAVISCAGVSNVELLRAKTIACTKQQFADQPFGFELTVENLEQHYKPALKSEHFLMNGQPDEAYRFFKGQTELLFRKAYNSPLEVMSGTIHSSKVKLMNGICAGISRKEFFWKFSDWQYDSADVLTLHSPSTGCSFHFLFARDKLKSIKIVNRQRELERLHRNRISELKQSKNFHHF
ncbi:MAG: hypothetical protein LBU62_04715 [Bacteroidales bacterium]|jgi:hypothetical protein|nr:hypothetical protein [Bacteroidales bacterium]